MIDPVNMQRLAQLRQQEYLQIAEQERNAKPLLSTVVESVNKVVARLTALTSTAPVQTATAPDITEACVEC